MRGQTLHRYKLLDIVRTDGVWASREESLRQDRVGAVRGVEGIPEQMVDTIGAEIGAWKAPKLPIQRAESTASCVYDVESCMDRRLAPNYLTVDCNFVLDVFVV